MSDIKHTPFRPVRVIIQGNPAHCWDVISDRYAIISDAGYVEKETAYLFAAAPDMLAALKELSAAYFELAGIPASAANSAISKAEGGDQ
jgi:hypothetical protein